MTAFDRDAARKPQQKHDIDQDMQPRAADAQATPRRAPHWLAHDLYDRYTAPTQRKAHGATPSAPEAVHGAARHGTSGAAGPLPYLAQIQRAFGRHDVSRVQAHGDGAAGEGAAAMGAEAFASGEHVAFAGAPDLHTAAHEAAHVVQQRGGVQLVDGVGASSDAHERHADEVADLVVRGESAEVLLDRYAGGVERAPAVHGGAGEAVQHRVIVARNAQEKGGKLADAIAAIREFWKTKSVVGIPKGHRGHPIFTSFATGKYKNRESMLALLEAWLGDAKDDAERTFATWEKALEQLNLEDLSNITKSKKTDEEREAEKRSLAGLLNDNGKRGRDDDDDDDDGDGRAPLPDLPTLRRQASILTDDMLRENNVDTAQFAKYKKSRLMEATGERGTLMYPLRRKMHKAKISKELPAGSVRYKTFTGTIDPDPKAFVTGTLPAEYGPLFSHLVDGIAKYTADSDSPLTDKEVARLLLHEMETEDDVFATFPEHVQNLAHKIITIILYAELSRGSLAPLNAAATFHAVANRPGQVAKDDKSKDGEAKDGTAKDDKSKAKPVSFGLVDVFNTGSEHMRPLFAGEGGAELLRGNTQDRDRERRTMDDMQAYYGYCHGKYRYADAEAFTRGETRRIIELLARKSGVAGAGAGVDRRPPKKPEGVPPTLAGVGRIEDVSGAGMDCLIRALLRAALPATSVDERTVDIVRDHLVSVGVAAHGQMLDLVRLQGGVLISFLVTQRILGAERGIVVYGPGGGRTEVLPGTNPVNLWLSDEHFRAIIPGGDAGDTEDHGASDVSGDESISSSLRSSSGSPS